MRVTDTSNGSNSKYWEDFFTDESAAEYMATYGEGPGSPLRKKISGLINKGESALDVGCGPGWNYDHFKEYGPEVRYKGTDYSKRFVRVANQRHPGVFEIGDVRRINERSESWDTVLLQDVLEHTNGYEKPLREALRVARKRVIVTFWHLKDEDDPHINDDGADTYGSWYDKREWEKFLNKLGYPWLHEEMSRNRGQETYWHIYIIDKGDIHG